MPGVARKRIHVGRIFVCITTSRRVQPSEVWETRGKAKKGMRMRNLLRLVNGYFGYIEWTNLILGDLLMRVDGY